MTALFAAFIETAGKFLILGAAAFFGVVCGKKFTEEINSNQEAKDHAEIWCE